MMLIRPGILVVGMQKEPYKDGRTESKFDFVIDLVCASMNGYLLELLVNQLFADEDFDGVTDAERKDIDEVVHV